MNSEDIIRLLDEIGTRLTDPGTHVYELVVRQVVAEAVASLITFVIFAIAGLIVLRWGIRSHVRESEEPTYNPKNDLTYGQLGGGAGVCTIFFAWLATNPTADIVRLLNPEYAALERIVTTLTNAVP